MQSQPEPIAAYDDQDDKIIGAQLARRAQTVAAGQSAPYELTITNNGRAKASFDVQVTGLPQDWLAITPPQVNLGKSESAMVNIVVSPPSGRPGTFPAAVVVTSPEHPTRSSQVGFTLTVHPARRTLSLRRLLPAAIALLGLALVLLFWFLIVRPHVYHFSATPPVVQAGEAVTVRWRTNPLAGNLSIDGLTAPVSGWSGETIDFPPPPARIYHLSVSNGLARLLFPNLVAQAQQTVLVVPQAPSIRSFAVSGQGTLQPGDTIIVSWAVERADEVWLWIGPTSFLIPPDEHVGYLDVVIQDDTLLALEARSSGGIALKSMMAWLYATPPSGVPSVPTPEQTPTPTPLPPFATSPTPTIPIVATPTSTPTSTHTPTPTSTPTPTVISTPDSTVTVTPTAPVLTATSIPTPTATYTSLSPLASPTP